jgi:peptidoglycan/xylan/chitin deacetylase (PgdA/CDA1 family)
MAWSDEVLTAQSTRRYLSDTVRVWLGLRSGDAPVPALPVDLARSLLRLEEHERGERDPWGGWPASSMGASLRRPEIDLWLDRVRRELPPDLALEPRWPSGKRFVVCVTHDVDLLGERLTPAQAFRHARAGLAGGVSGRGESAVRLVRPAVRITRATRSGLSFAPSLRDTLERALDLESAHGASASFFFTVPPHAPRSRYDCVYAPRDRCLFRGRRVQVADVMRAIAEEGFDVGLHGSYAAGLSSGALTDERATLESATGLEIRTTRQHFLRWDIRSTPRYQEEAGLRADASMGFNFDVGYRAGTSLPFRLFDVHAQTPRDLIEVPLVAQDGALLGANGLALSEPAASRLLRELVEVTAASGGVLTLLFHPDKLVRPEWLALFEGLLEHAAEQDAWMTSLAQLNDWWRAREARILAA